MLSKVFQISLCGCKYPLLGKIVQVIYPEFKGYCFYLRYTQLNIIEEADFWSIQWDSSLFELEATLMICLVYYSACIVVIVQWIDWIS